MKRDLLLWARIILALLKSTEYKTIDENETHNLSLMQQTGLIYHTYGSKYMLRNKGYEFAAYASMKHYAEAHAFLLDLLGAVPFDLLMTETKTRARAAVKAALNAPKPEQ